MSQSPKPQAVLLGLHKDDALNVFVRNADGELHQAAKIMTHNGVEVGAMTAIMADLSDTFGWDRLASVTSGVPQTTALSRGVRVGLPAGAAPARAPKPEPEPEPTVEPKHRRSKADLEVEFDAIVKLLRKYDETHPLGVTEIAQRMALILDMPLVTVKTSVPRSCKALAEEGRIFGVKQPRDKFGRNSGYRYYAKVTVQAPAERPEPVSVESPTEAPIGAVPPPPSWVQAPASDDQPEN